ncbi:hypothetical protein GCM10027050_16140 [Psychrosphaera aestuarii]
MFEPMALPTDVSVAPFNAALAETIISGAEEPIATIVKPMIIGEIPRFLAKPDAPYTNLSAPHTKTAKEIIRIIEAINMIKKLKNIDKIVPLLWR